MMSNLKKEQLADLFSYSIDGLTENTDYILLMSIKNSYIVIVIDYMVNGQETTFRIKNKKNFVSTTG
jgi:hypothetical protein